MSISPSTIDGGGNPLKSPSYRDVLIKSSLPIFFEKFQPRMRILLLPRCVVEMLLLESLDEKKIGCWFLEEMRTI